MASDVDIVNIAFSMIGEDPITSLADDTERARLANRVYNSNRDAVLRAHPWNCAVARAALALLSTAPAFGWGDQFQLPSDPYCLRVLALNDDESCGYPGDTFKVEGRKLLTNSTVANIRFIKRITDPNDYDSLLYETVACRLAATLGYSTTGSQQGSQSLWQLYELKLKEARTINGQEGSPDMLVSGFFNDR